MSWENNKIVYELPSSSNHCSRVFRIIIDDGCYVVLIPDCGVWGSITGWDGQSWKPTPWVFPAALKILKTLENLK